MEIYDAEDPIQGRNLVAAGGCSHSLPQPSEHCLSEPEEGECVQNDIVCTAPPSGLSGTAPRSSQPEVAKLYLLLKALCLPGLTLNGTNRHGQAKQTLTHVI